MRVYKYPAGMLDKIHVCSNCGCKVKLNSRDIGKITLVDDIGSVFVECPICKNTINVLEHNKLTEQIYDSIFKVIKDKAQEIKQLNEGEIKDSLKELVDNLYNDILDGRKDIDGKGV